MLTNNDIKSIVWDASSKILRHTITIYYVFNKRHLVFCNGVLFKDHDQAYILTAEHIFNSTQPGDLKIFQNGSFCILEGTIVGNTNYDIALFEIDPTMAACLSDNYEFLVRTKLLFNHKPEYKLKYLLVGYPSSKTIIKGTIIKEKPIVYHTVALRTQQKSNEILFSYNKRKSRKYETLGYSFAPDPNGLSGSGLWYVTAFPNCIQYNLVGLFKEFDRKKNIGISTRIDCLKEKLK